MNQVVLIAVADLHWSATAPVARSVEKNWAKAMHRPWKQLVRLAEEHGCPVVVAGDFFHKADGNPAWLINWAIRRLRELPVKCFGIPGNHDLRHHSLEDLKKTSYWTLVESGVLTHMEPGKPTELASIRLHAFPFGFPLKPLEKRSSLSLEIAVVHRFVWTRETGHPGAVETDRADNVARRMANFDLVICGDNHCSFFVKGKGNLPHVLNCGGFGNRNHDERHRRPRAWLVKEDGSVDFVELDCSRDKWADVQEIATDIQGSEATDEFVRELEAMGDRHVDFAEAVKQLMKKRGVSDETKRLVLDALEEEAA